MTALAITCLLSLAILSHVKVCSALKIVHLAVPSSVANNTDAAVLLDCDYSLESSSVDGLVVKWFLNDAPNPVYQWIPGRSPQDLGLLKGRVDLKYRASESNNTMYRAVRIVRPGPDISGLYTCTVSTFDDEARQTKRMTVYTPATKFEFWQQEDGENITLHCLAKGLHPLPVFNITASGDKIGSYPTDVNITKTDGLYDCKAEMYLSKKELATKSTFRCVLSLPLTDYNLTKTINIPPAVRTTPSPEGFRTSLVSSPGHTVPHHYDPEIFFIRTYQDGANSGSSIEAAAFSIFLLSFLTVQI